MSTPRHKVTAMFNRIAPSYDRMNRFLALGIDQLWRRRLKKEIPKKGPLFLVDLATGTADQILALTSLSQIEKFLGLDLSEKMLSYGQKKIESKGFASKVSLQLGSALSIPLQDNSTDIMTISFGIRNTESPSLCLSEMYRCLKPGGKALILEFSLPKKSFLRSLYLLHLQNVVPRIGSFFSKDHTAYTYLAETIQTFPSGSQFLDLMKQAGFKETKEICMTFGIVTLYVGCKTL